MRTLATLAAALAAAIIWIADANAAEAYTVDPISRVMTVTTPANVRAGPGQDYAVRVVLAEGVTVRVTGAVRDRDWLRVDLRGDGSEAFIYAPLLKEAAFSAPSSRSAPTGPSPRISRARCGMAGWATSTSGSPGRVTA